MFCRKTGLFSLVILAGHLLAAHQSLAEMDLLLAARDTGEIFRVNEDTGEIVEVFATGANSVNYLLQGPAPDFHVYVSEGGSVRRYYKDTGQLVEPTFI